MLSRKADSDQYDGPTQQEKVESWLLDKFSRCSVWASKVLEDLAEVELSCSKTVFGNARRKLGIRSRQVGRSWEVYMPESVERTLPQQRVPVGYQTDAGRDVVSEIQVILSRFEPTNVRADVRSGEFLRERSGLASRGVKLLGHNQGWLTLVSLVEPQVELPARARVAQVVDLPGSQVVLLTAAQDERVTYLGTEVISTHLSVAIPEGFMGLLSPWRDMLVSGGVIDAGYRGEIKVMVISFRKRGTTIRRGDIIARLNILPLANTKFVVGDLPPGERGDKGFGSTGV